MEIDMFDAAKFLKITSINSNKFAVKLLKENKTDVLDAFNRNYVLCIFNLVQDLKKKLTKNELAELLYYLL